jgi:hypothetical protein
MKVFGTVFKVVKFLVKAAPFIKWLLNTIKSFPLLDKEQVKTIEDLEKEK